MTQVSLDLTNELKCLLCYSNGIVSTQELSASWHVMELSCAPRHTVIHPVNHAKLGDPVSFCCCCLVQMTTSCVGTQIQLDVDTDQPITTSPQLFSHFANPPKSMCSSHNAIPSNTYQYITILTYSTYSGQLEYWSVSNWQLMQSNLCHLS